MPANEPEFAAEDFAAAAGVSRETLARFKAYVELLRDWNARHNLVSAASLEDVWRRHVWDSAQLAALIPSTATCLVDLGSGAGFPGLVLATLMSDRVRVTLYEATAKKCAFLRDVAGRLKLNVDIRNRRIEDAEDEFFDVVTARACSPLAKLLGYAQHFAGPRTICLFLKGQNVGDELTEARKYWKMQLQQHPSLTDPSGRILEIRELAYVVPTQAPPHPGRRQPKGRRR
ncbi:MAG TPA: 16S rRNA (guanine(527)-N(7))-methyltransferase RsmG [Rhizomicrobium sp.]|nr:16S rRNA (guanine(527)-N(7))-methyltransferase RsmG [Rhizomicrobium sp.]